MKKIAATLLLSTALLSSCDRFIEEGEADSPIENFDYLAERIKNEYTYFTVKNIDWDSVVDHHRTDISEDMSKEELFEVLTKLIAALRDDHSNLVSDFRSYGYGIARRDGKVYKEGNLIYNLYLKNSFELTAGIQHGFINDDPEVGYMTFFQFSGAFDDDNLSYIFRRFKDTKGLIVDIRGNGGGSSQDVITLLSRFIDEKTTVWWSREKAGKGRDDFTSWREGSLSPEGSQKYLKKIILLTDVGTFSAGSFTALACKAIDRVTIVGTTTGGGLGLPNGGYLPNSWFYRFSITQTADASKEHVEWENGVPPDVEVVADPTDRSQDEVIEKAVELIKQ